MKMKTILGVSLALSFLLCGGMVEAVEKGIVYSVGQRGVPDPLKSYDSFANLGLAKTAAIKETPACKAGLESWQVVALRESVTLTLGYESAEVGAGRVGAFAVNAAAHCIKVGEPIHLGQAVESTGFYLDVGWFMPTGITKMDPNLAIEQSNLILAAGLFGTPDPVLFVSGRSIVPVRPVGGGILAPRVEGARAIDRNQMEAAIRNGNRILDIRSPEEFQREHVKGSINVRYWLGRRAKGYVGPEHFGEQGDRFDVDALKPFAQEPLVVIGDSPSDFTMYRAVRLLVQSGFKKVFFFAEGLDYFRGRTWKTPTASAHLKIIGAPELAGLLRNPALKPELIDVRLPEEFAAGAIPGSWLSSYNENPILPVRQSPLSTSVLLNAKESIDVPNTVPQTSPVVLIGASELDFRPYKAALLLKSQGYSNVYWFRSGIGSWRRAGFFDPVRFPIALYAVQPRNYVGRPTPLPMEKK